MGTYRRHLLRQESSSAN
uniref:Uncharacterized protein n=1 Tax=Ditylenchus dipsaci TaxID=166011 RepID=A0A915DI87_9BILA